MDVFLSPKAEFPSATRHGCSFFLCLAEKPFTCVRISDVAQAV
jgi:hypothetical protein